MLKKIRIWKSGYLDLAIKALEADNFFFKWILFNQKLEVKKKIRKIADPENPDFNGCARILASNPLLTTTGVFKLNLSSFNPYEMSTSGGKFYSILTH